MALAESVDAYLAHLESDRRVTSATLANYRSTLKRFAVKHEDLTEKSIRAFLRSYSHSASANTVRIRLLGLVEFLDLPSPKIPRAKEPVKQTEALTAEEFTKLVAAAKDIDPRVSDIILFLGKSGLRFGEFLSLRPESLVEIDGISNMQVLGKGQKFRLVPLKGEMLDLFARLALPLPTDLHEKKLRALMHEAGVKAGLRIEVHPHLLRASCASGMFARGVDSLTVSKLLGWSSVDMFYKRYYRPTVASLAAAMA